MSDKKFHAIIKKAILFLCAVIAIATLVAKEHRWQSTVETINNTQAARESSLNREISALKRDLEVYKNHRKTITNINASRYRDKLFEMGFSAADIRSIMNETEVWLNIDWLMEHGDNIKSVRNSMVESTIWLSIDRLMEYGDDIEEIFACLTSQAISLRIDELVTYGINIDKIANAVDLTSLWLNQDKFIAYGANINAIRNRILSDGDSYLVSLIQEGKLYPNN